MPGGPSRAPVPRIGRLLDVVGLVLFVAGLAVYGRAWVGMRGLEAAGADPSAPLFSGMREFDRWWELSRVGVSLMVLGGLIALVAAGVAWWLRR